MIRRVGESILGMLTQFIISIIISFLVFLIYLGFDKATENYLYNAFFLFLVSLFFEKISVIYQNSKIHKFWHYICLILLVASSIFLGISIPDSLGLYKNGHEFNSNIYLYVSILLLILNFIILFVINFYNSTIVNNYKKRLKFKNNKTFQKRKDDIQNEVDSITEGL